MSPPKDSTQLHHDHSPEGIVARIAEDRKQSLLRDVIYGSIDGCVTTFAVVSGVVGADLSSGIVLVLGFANLIADGFSMAVSNYLGTKADQQLLEKARAIEEEHIRVVPEGERYEIKEIFRRKGFEGELLERVVDVIVSDRKRWVDTMLTEEWGLSLTPLSPWKAATATLLSFIVVGFVPLLPYTISALFNGSGEGLFVVSCVMTAMTFLGIGAFKSLQVDRHWLRGSIETLLMGGGAAVLAYVVGVLLKELA